MSKLPAFLVGPFAFGAQRLRVPCIGAGLSMSLALVLAGVSGGCTKRQFNTSSGTRSTTPDAGGDWGMRDYASACFDALGGLPDGEDLDCGRASEILITKNGIDQTQTLLNLPADAAQVQCDEPIMSVRNAQLGGCVPGNRIRRFQRGDVDFVYICRRRDTRLHGKKVTIGGRESELYDAIALIGHNRTLNTACFIERTNTVEVEVENKDGSKEKLMAAAGSLGADFVPPLVPKGSPDLAKIEQHWGPLSIDCTSCHSTKAFVRSPAVVRTKGVVSAGGPAESALPKMSKLQDKAMPYRLVDEANVRKALLKSPYVKAPHPTYGRAMTEEDFQGIGKPRVLTGTLVKACVTCHDVGGRDYINTLIPQATGYFPTVLANDAHAKDSFFQYVGGRIDNASLATVFASNSTTENIFAESFHDPKFFKAHFGAVPTQEQLKALLDPILACGQDPLAPDCEWDPIDALR